MSIGDTLVGLYPGLSQIKQEGLVDRFGDVVACFCTLAYA